MITVDFHCHSCASDGTFSPSELAARSRGFSAIALTDHDNCTGVAEFLAKPRKEGEALRFAGIELSIEPGVEFDRFHLLGIGIDPNAIGLKVFLERVLQGRNERNRQIFENFRRLGIEIEHCEGEGKTIFDYANGKVLARPHFARWLVDHGYGNDIRAMFSKYLLPDSPIETRCYEERWHPTQEESFEVIHAAGGLCIMAHPKYWRNEWKGTGVDYVAAARELTRLREAGLDGVEALYAANTPAENVEFTRIGMELGYLLSAGSDFHGANKPEIALGMQVDEKFIAPLLERLTAKNMV